MDLFGIAIAALTASSVAIIGLAWLARRRPGLELQRLGSVPQAIATLIGVLVIAVGWFVTSQQALRRDIIAEQRQKASAIAEYVGLALSLKETDDDQTYRRANQLASQLFLWLPADVYRELGRGLANHSSKLELFKSMVDVRRSLLGCEAGTLGPEDIIVHGPGIGRIEIKRQGPIPSAIGSSHQFPR